MIGAFNGSNTYQPADMPDIDILVITHDHYDHLDHKTVTALRDKVKQVVCSLGVGAHLLQWGYTAEQVHELYWHESVTIDHELIFTAEPARHFSGRGITRNRSLWSAFVLQTPDRRIFLGGDSGYGKHFADIGSRYSGFDLALLECGQYNPAWKYIHMMPEETVQAAKELGATTLIPVHWGKFALSLHAWHEPADRVFAEASRLGFPLATPMIGEPFLIGSKPLKQEWWRSIC
jgi:L-ascorbate metabolism protein UlaG (beta-lactamase superfamily)